MSTVNKGRPVSDTVTKAILDVTLEQLAERGFDNTRLSDITRAARTSKQALYRRWRDKRTLVTTAVTEALASLAPPPPERANAAADLYRLMTHYEREVLDRPAGRALQRLRAACGFEAVVGGFEDEMRFAFRQALVATPFEADMETRITLLIALLWYRAENAPEKRNSVDQALFLVLGLSPAPDLLANR
jgi:AcrR family transcriptional regulator